MNYKSAVLAAGSNLYEYTGLKASPDKLIQGRPGVMNTPLTPKECFHQKPVYVKDSILNIFHFSDTHGNHELIRVPKCDIAIFSGDESTGFNPSKSYKQTCDFIHWFSMLDVETKIFVAGNHSTALASTVYGPELKEEMEKRGIIYLEDELYEHYSGLTIYGNPATEYRGDHWAFNYVEDRFKNIPSCDIIVTHCPPYGILDSAPAFGHKNLIEHCGSERLLNQLKQIDFKLNLFGHIHDNKLENYGYLCRNKRFFVNSAVVEDNVGLTHNGHLITMVNKEVVRIQDVI